ncbi:NeuD/PglB/VioB family sugar acetyltransferase [Hymenobacter yonginensis]|uniref:NeuD/PglB/VioB family sugar acetyltransferase n=1 Tax=Hymenobacter yonginensis TaxID=748197 RepID=A0ABY7PQZ3_9BACT|nr:NeuD/PglB/VioB family sugar acetyltransferase [Hymenobacter yonginensis]WBO84975.1 NeuD/PglB/VioB family sugar acetyltransferase [Hymenobacter yonginensis]
MPGRKPRIAIVGAGALGQQMAQHLRQQGRGVAGFFDDTHHTAATAEGPVLGPLTAVAAAYAAGCFEELLLGIGYRHMARRQQLFEELQAAGIPFGQFIHPSAYVDPSVQLGPGVFISPGCVLDLNVVLHANVLLYTGCVVAHDTQIGPHSLLAPGVRLAGCVQVGARCFLGVGTTVIDSLVLGADVRTGGGSVVIDSLPEPGTYVGVPARRLR